MGKRQKKKNKLKLLVESQATQRRPRAGIDKNLDASRIERSIISFKRLNLREPTITEIAVDTGLSKSCVRESLRETEAHYRMDKINLRAARKAQVDEGLNWLELEVKGEWERSKADYDETEIDIRHTATEKGFDAKIEDFAATAGLMVGKKIKRKRGRGDASLAKTLLDIHRVRMDLHGLEEPKKFVLTQEAAREDGGRLMEIVLDLVPEDKREEVANRIEAHIEKAFAADDN